MQLRHQIPLTHKSAQISGIKSGAYRYKTECPPGCPDRQLVKLGMTMEQRIYNFFSDASDKLGFVAEVPDLFDHLAADHLQNKKKLQTIV